MAHFLHVRTDDGAVGHLGFEAHADRYTFQYDEAWQARAGAFPLSPHIPLRGDEPKPGAIHRFLANLLPEGRALEVATHTFQLTKDNTFGLVRRLGQEPVGALSFLAVDPEGGERAAAPAPEADVPPARRVVTNEELSERIRDRDTIPFPVWDGKVRLSVAGYQDKLQVLVEGDQISFVNGGPLSSTYILKPDSRNSAAPHMVANEHYCMALADRIGLPVASVILRRIPEPILLIQRFDREVVLDPADGVTAQSVRRVHVIDGCQALDVPVSFKYERNFGNTTDVRNIREGISFEKLFSLEPFFESSAMARLVMLRWALFQMFIGNSDAHGKNMSFYVRNAGITPAPFYDLVSVNAYGGHVEQDMAMAYGDAFKLEEITPYALADFAHRTGMPAALVAREITRMAHVINREAPDLAQSETYVQEERDLVHRIAGFIAAQVDRLLRLAPEITKVDPDLL